MTAIKTILSIALCLCGSSVFAQHSKPKAERIIIPNRSTLYAENTSLKITLDSLQSLVDSLQQRRYLEDSVLVSLMEGNRGDRYRHPASEYTPEQTDSLLQLWYHNSAISDFDTVHEFDMDSVRFSSNVSDSVMMRRLADMNSFISLPFNSNVKNYIILYSEKMPQRMARVMGLGRYYFPIFEEILSKYSLPLELKYMAVVESMLNPTATSRAGAKGIWQFMYSTGRSYGLEINSYVDERMDVVKSMDAAARYLADAYNIFGDWALAISSYNCGAGNVSKAIRRAGGSRNYWDIYTYLPRETRGYVPAFVGVIYALNYHREYGLEAAEVGMPAAIDTFEIKKNLHFAQISEVVGVPMQDITNLNPQYFNSVIPGDNHSYILRLPSNWSGAFLETPMDSIYNHKRDSLFNAKVIKDVRDSRKSSGQNRIAYKVRSGDYLGKIAQRYGVSVNQIKNWNNLRSTNIRAGQTLYIYSSKAGSSSSSSSTTTASASSGSAATYYTVKAGDTLYDIAKLYPGVSADNIKAANGLKNSNIRPGQKLKIPRP